MEHRWFCHLLRRVAPKREGNRRFGNFPRGVTVMNAKVDERSARGRPRFGWMDEVKRALNDRRMDVREASESARDRNEWRMIVTQF